MAVFCGSRCRFGGSLEKSGKIAAPTGHSRVLLYNSGVLRSVCGFLCPNFGTLGFLGCAGNSQSVGTLPHGCRRNSSSPLERFLMAAIGCLRNSFSLLVCFSPVTMWNSSPVGTLPPPSPIASGFVPLECLLPGCLQAPARWNDPTTFVSGIPTHRINAVI